MLKSGYGHNIAIIASGDIYSWGNNKYGQLGLGNNDDQNIPQLVEFFKDKQIKKIKCGRVHTIAITENGDVYSWGFNGNGQLGLGNNDNQNIPQQVDFFKDKQIREIKCGSYYTIAITENGDIYSWGDNSSGQLGLGNYNDQNNPQLVEFFKDKRSCLLQHAYLHIIKLICGSDHIFAISNSGEVYSWGYNEDGQLGLGHQRENSRLELSSSELREKEESFFEGHNVDQNIPQPVDFFKDKPSCMLQRANLHIKKIICGQLHSFAITVSGEVYSWGNNEYGQLGLGYNNEYGQLRLGYYNDQNIPQQVEFFKDKQIKEIKCGDFHTIAITDNGEVYSWGDNYSSQLGLGHNYYKKIPQLVEFFKDKQIKIINCGARHTFAITDIGEVYSWGDNSSGQLGLGNYISQNIPQQVEFFKEQPIFTRISKIKSARNATFNS